jgi:hypothetical protein
MGTATVVGSASGFLGLQRGRVLWLARHPAAARTEVLAALHALPTGQGETAVHVQLDLAVREHMRPKQGG